ncbi:phosphatidylinositol-glycan biosynthesis class X protein [Kryptolebias marmoratus]|uniref:Phosphatidylinositol-glycan biosynthesis class X protein n=1 Tax=Kryptolebias marmoratus TaxID=37003 RepID=A0A3Q2ZPL7_KRYMA|nr:phosphatidylinositol-glycan biosynthesis class X protein [Kryptolebias marmoratus]
MYFPLFIVLTSLSTYLCFVKEDDVQDHCDLLKQWLESSTVSVELNKLGFHREVTATVELRPDVLSGVSVLLVSRWPSGVYVDPYQLASLRDQSDWQILLDSAIDLEAPAHKASGFLTYVYTTNIAPTSTLQKVTIPVHGRYHEPSFAGETFTSVYVEPPELLLRSEKCTHLNRLEPHAVVDAPCTASNSSMCSWVKTHHPQEPSAVSFQLPVGDGSAVALVCGGTLLVTVICCVALSKSTLKHRIR